MPHDYIETYYSRCQTGDEHYPVLQGNRDTDVCIVGGGLAGLTAALELWRRGRQVTILEGNRIAWGASGRNGGFVSPGYACSQTKIARKGGTDQGKTLYRLLREGVDIVA